MELEDGRVYDTYKAKVKGETIKSFKSKIVNNILEKTLSPINQKLDKIMKQDILKNRNQDLFFKDSNLKSMFVEIYSNLPEDRNKWNYATLSKDPKMKVLIDKLSKTYIDNYHSQDFKKFQDVLKTKTDEYNKAYGIKSNFVYDNTINDLYKRMGNSILGECKKYDKCINKDSDFLIKSQLNNSVSKLKKSLRKDYETEKNRHEFEKLKQQIENEKSL